MNAAITKTQQPKLPDGWKWAKLGDVANFFDSKRKPVSQTERRKRIFGKKESQLFPYYGANGQLGWIDDFIFDFPTILLAEDGGHFGSSQKPVSYIAHGKYWVNNHAHVIHPKDGVDLEYLHYSIMIRPDLQTSGSTVPKLNQRMAREIILPLPPLDEQKRIAVKLNEQMNIVAEARNAAEEQLEAAKALPNAYLRQIFPSNGDILPDGWKWVKLQEISKIFAGGDAPIGNISNDKTEEFSIPIISNGTREKSLYGYTKKPKVTEPAITISARGTIGYTELMNEPFYPMIRVLVNIPDSNLVHLDHLVFAIQSLNLAGCSHLNPSNDRNYDEPSFCFVAAFTRTETNRRQALQTDETYYRTNQIH